MHIPRDLPYELDDPESPISASHGQDILVVDDNQTNLIAIEAALQPLGRTLVLARSGIEALARLLEQDFVLLILDVAMPGLDGFETAKMVRSRERSRSTPIIFITGLSWQDDAVMRGYELGAFDFLVKPIRPDVLRAKASVFVQLQERTLELQRKADELEREQARALERELVAQRKRFEAEVMSERVAQLAEIDRRKDEFLAILSHELRNPLQPLQTAVELLDHDPSAPVPPRVRSIIRRQVHHIARLIDDLLDISRLTAGKLELRREPVNLDDIVEEAVQSCRHAIESRRHQLECSPSVPTIVDGDPIRLVQVVVNLISNAAKYTDPGGRILVEHGTTGGSGFVRVTDDGKGIPEELLPSIFDMFVQERTTPDGAGGLGLGLGLVKRLVEMHGGTVHASSLGVGRGATFEIRIGLAESQQIDGNPGREDETSGDERPLRMLVCDDAPDLRELVADLLRLRGHDVVAVEDGPQAIAAMREGPFDVALIDIGLPDMDGYEVARRIRREALVRQPRLIAMTGYGQASDRAAAFDAGYDAHLVKPASAEKILRAVHDEPRGEREDRE